MSFAVHSAGLGEGDATRRLQGIVWMTVAGVLWTLIEALGGQVPRGYSPYQTVWVRYATHLAFMLVVLGPRQGVGQVRTRRPGLQILRSLLMLGMPACFIAAIGRLSGAETWSVFWVSPLLIAVISRWWLGERLRLRHWAAATFPLIGAALILGVGPGAFRRAVVLPLGMAACFSVYVVMTRAMPEETTTANLFYTALFVLIPLSFGLVAFWQPLTRQAASIMIAIGLVGFLLLLALDKALHLAPASVVAPFVCLQLVWTRLLDQALFGYHIGAGQICGVTVLVGGGLFMCVREWRDGHPYRRV